MKLSRYKHDSAVSYAFGATLIYELLNTHPKDITRIFLRPNIKHGADLKKLLQQLKTHHIEIIESTKAFNILNAKDNCLITAEFTKIVHPLEWTPEAPHLVLVNPSDSGNLGTIIRTAVAFGYTNLAIITPAVDHFDPKVVRASMGAIFHLNIEAFGSFDAYLQKYGQLQNDPTAKRALYSFMLRADSQTLTNTHPQNSYFAIIMGNEATGLPESFAAISQTVYIPQTPLVDSLNLAVATSLALYHFRAELQKL